MTIVDIVYVIYKCELIREVNPHIVLRRIDFLQIIFLPDYNIDFFTVNVNDAVRVCRDDFFTHKRSAIKIKALGRIFRVQPELHIG